MVYTLPSAGAAPDAGQNPGFASNPGICQACLRSPAAELTAVKQTGMLFVRESSRIQAVLCQSCGTAVYRQAQAHNIAFGWWGLIAFLTNLFTLAGNFSRARKHRMIGSSADMPLRAPLNPGRPVWLRPHMIVPMALVAAIGAAGIASTGHESVPALHAGQCIDVPAKGTFTDVKLVPCDEPHDGEVAGVISASDTSASSDTGEACARLAASHVLLSKAEDVDLSTLEPVSRSEKSAHSSVRAICVLTGLNDTKLTGHVAG